MALDNLLLERVGRGESPSTFRLYGWSISTLSLGRNQAPSVLGFDISEKSDEFVIVQRPTGGAVAVHGKDLSYSLASPYPCQFLPPRPKVCYQMLHDAMAKALEDFGCGVECAPEDLQPDYRDKIYCGLTQSPYDIVGKDRKLVGSAQRISKRAILQHGFILLDEDFGWVRNHLGNEGEKVAHSSIALKELLPEGQILNLETLQKNILNAVENTLQIKFQKAPLTPDEEQELAGVLV